MWNFADIIFLAIIAGLLLYRLRTLLGRKDFNNEGGIKNNNLGKLIEQQKTQILKPLREKPAPETKYYNKVVEPKITDERINSAIESIKAIDKSFTPGHFLAGARIAFEMVLNSFIKNDKDSLKNLLDDSVYKEFIQAMEARSEPDRVYETTLLAITSSDIIDVTMSGKVANITVRFVSEQVDLVKDKEGKIVEGNPSQIHVITDTWTFSRNVASPNPNWKLVATDDHA